MLASFRRELYHAVRAPVLLVGVLYATLGLWILASFLTQGDLVPGVRWGDSVAFPSLVAVALLPAPGLAVAADAFPREREAGTWPLLALTRAGWSGTVAIKLATALSVGLVLSGTALLVLWLGRVLPGAIVARMAVSVLAVLLIYVSYGMLAGAFAPTRLHAGAVSGFLPLLFAILTMELAHVWIEGAAGWLLVVNPVELVRPAVVASLRGLPSTGLWLPLAVGLVLLILAWQIGTRRKGAIH